MKQTMITLIVFLIIMLSLISRASSQQVVTSFTLINADNDQVVPGFQSLTGITTLNLATLPTKNLSIRANCTPLIVGSVLFGYDFVARYRTENIRPYSFTGDNLNGDYYSWTPTLGPHTITATPYTLSGTNGIAGTKLTWSFNVIDQLSLNIVNIHNDTSIICGNTRYNFHSRIDTTYGIALVKLDTTGWWRYPQIVICDSSLIGK